MTPSLRERIEEAEHAYHESEARRRTKCVFAKVITCCRIQCRHPEGKVFADGVPLVPARCSEERCRFWCPGLNGSAGLCKWLGKVVEPTYCATCREGRDVRSEYAAAPEEDLASPPAEATSSVS